MVKIKGYKFFLPIKHITMNSVNSRVQQMKIVHLQADIREHCDKTNNLTNSIEQIYILFKQIKQELKIERNEVSFNYRDDVAIKDVFLTIHYITGKIICEKKQITRDKLKKDALDLFARKNADYGDAFAEFGPVGVIVRIGDKIFRLKTLNKRKENKQMVTDESILDTYEDLYNYTAMVVMLINEGIPE